MEFKGVKIYVIIIVIFLVICLYFAGQLLYRAYNIDMPLKEDLMVIEGISNVSLVNNEEKVDLYISFLPDQDFFALYQKIFSIMKDRLGSKSGDIIIQNKDNNLKEVYHKIHFSIYEGIHTCKFVEMEKNINKIVEKEELDDYKLWVDNDAVYIQLDKNKDSFYKRIPYNNSIIVKRTGADYYG